MDYELRHARKIAFLGTLAYVALVYVAVNAALGWTQWPSALAVALAAVVGAGILALLPSRD